jgi:hypothetical protein
VLYGGRSENCTNDGSRQIFYITASVMRRVAQYSIWLQTRRPGFDPVQGRRIFPLTSASRLALGPTQPPIQWVPGALSLGVKRSGGVTLTTHPLLVPRLRKSRSYTSCHPNVPRWGVTGPLYLLTASVTCYLHLIVKLAVIVVES